ncbi:hypothetical protein ACFFTN_08190 [Aminobacter aganoensis]|uniref:Uncharacterized protein n=1 Tax=Aminobacter aganoensis TaxID=83264 RepID=A0A7X0F8E5_9HYPH|nr:hypothetical protein [Aminobacter aganoensis]MBB6355046.1 hypothetical protein [Aminobacter aganoensis]
MFEASAWRDTISLWWARQAGKRKIAWKWASIAFGVPTAISVLANFNSKLDFGPLLSRIVLGFNTVSMHAWGAVGQVLGISLDKIHGALSFCLICAGAAIAAYYGTKTERRLAFDRFTICELVSQSTLVAVLNAPTRVFDAVAIFLSALLGTGYFIYSDRLIISVKFYLLILAATAAGLYAFSYSTPVDATQVAIITFMLFSILTLKFVGVRRLVFTRIMAFVIGIFALDRFGTVVMPAINDWLDRIGA